MTKKNIVGNSPLTESQALALSFWWKGRYLRIKSQHEGGQFLHGVELPLSPEAGSAVVYFWEEAKRVEHRRSNVNTGAPDWLG